jgi:hypothetical protein
MRLRRFGRIYHVLACALLRGPLDSASARGHGPACSSAQVVQTSISLQAQEAPPSVVVEGAEQRQGREGLAYLSPSFSGTSS